MEVKFEKNLVSCLTPVLQEIQNSEQTQELKVPDGMPDVGHILGCWGQPVIRGKAWDRDSVSFSGGMMVWVLYSPEDGSEERCIDTWIPFQMKWDLPENIPEGQIRISCLSRFVDGRSVSPRKMMIRCGLGTLAEAYVLESQEVFLPGETAEGVELLKNTYPVRLRKEAGEKTFLLDEEISIPEGAPQPEKLIYYRINPRITDKKVLTDKLVFRGNANLHLLYRCQEGQLHNWDFELPFSQYAQLELTHGTDAQGDVLPVLTSLELELEEGGRMRLKCGMVGQYVITDKHMLEVVEDAYNPGREMELEWDKLELPVVLENRREMVYAEQSIPAETDLLADVSFLPDFPRQRRMEKGIHMEIPASFQVLYYGTDGALHMGSVKWEGEQDFAAGEGSRVLILPSVPEPLAVIGNGQIQVKTEIPLDMVTTTQQEYDMVEGYTLGDVRKPDPNRPTLILCRAGDERLWDMAKAAGSTVDTIRRANGLQEEPVPGQMLLIPVN